MDYLWTPWRSTYMKAKDAPSRCVFCWAAQHPAEDAQTLVVHRAVHCFVILNRYPYTTGHLMIVPYDHVSRLDGMTPETKSEMMQLTTQAEQVLETIYKPGGLNLGMNLGSAAGAGIAQHLHLHMLPRWVGDANFMTTIADARIIPEALDETYQKIHQAFSELNHPPQTKI